MPEPLARRYRAIVLMQDARGLLVGMADPSDLHAYDELQAKLKQYEGLKPEEPAAVLAATDVGPVAPPTVIPGGRRRGGRR